MKRVFIGVPLSEELQGRVLEWQRKVQGLRLKVKDKIRWITGKNLHVTLVPPWQTDKWEVVSGKLKEIKFEPFEIKFDRITFGPNPEVLRMIWAAGDAPREIYDLRYKIYDLLGHQSEERPFRLHATLARLRSSPPRIGGVPRAESRGEVVESSVSIPPRPASLDTPPILGREAPRLPLKIDWRQTVSSFVLYESHLLPQGADYRVLARFP